MNATGKLPRILLVDDHRDTVEFVSRLLIKRGYTVLCASSIAEARDAAAKHKCEVLVSDVRLPDGNGIDLVREFQKQYGMKGVLVSGAVQDAAAIEAEGFKFLAKPVGLQILLDTLQSLSGK